MSDRSIRPDIEALAAKRDVPGLIVALGHNDEDVAQAAVRALAGIGAPAIEPLCAALRDGEWAVRWHAVDALGAIGVPAVEALIAALEESDMRPNAARALGEIGDPRAVAPLIAALEDREWVVCHGAACALGEIGAPAVEPLCVALKDSDRDVRYLAACALGEIGDPRAVEPLMAALKDGDWDVRRHAAWALGKIGDLYTPRT